MSPANFHRLFLRRLTYPPEGFRQSFYQVGGDQRVLSHGFTSYIAGEAVKVDSGDHSIENPARILGN